MTVNTETVGIRGYQLHRLVLHPNETPRGGLVFFHGQGDFIDRYPPLLSPFLEAGYRCILTDLPGHGRSPGKRGHVPGLDFIDELFEESLTHLDGPLVIAGHSMGGLMALRLFLKNPERFQAGWFSAPLLQILERAHPLLARFLPLVARIFPTLTTGTGVTSDQCGDFGDGPRSDAPDVDALCHSRISLGWGLELHRASSFVWESMARAPGAIPVLFTQGEDDRVCPPDVLRQLISQSPEASLDLELIPEARHEPFSGTTRDEFLLRLEKWTRKVLPA
jgi:lysophospholipase